MPNMFNYSPPGIFSGGYMPRYLDCILTSNASSEEEKYIRSLDSDAAWEYCDNHIFIPHFDLQRSKHKKKVEEIVPPYIERFSYEIVKKLSRAPDKNSSNLELLSHLV